MTSELALNASVRNFTYLGLYSENGEEEKIMGDSMKIIEYGNILLTYCFPKSHITYRKPEQLVQSKGNVQGR